jgi:hypothetical protein
MIAPHHLSGIYQDPTRSRYFPDERPMPPPWTRPISDADRLRARRMESRVAEGQGLCLLPPPQTVLADFPHTACPRTFEERCSPRGLTDPRNLRQGKTLHAEAHTCGSTSSHSMCHVKPQSQVRPRQGPFAPPELPGFHATTTPSDSCTGPKAVIHSHNRSHMALASHLPPAQVSQVPDRICRRPLSPITPESPTVALARYFTAGVMLRPFRHVGHSRERFNEAESGSRFRITADVVAFSSFALRVAPTHVESASWRTSNSHDQSLSTDKICQA